MASRKCVQNRSTGRGLLNGLAILSGLSINLSAHSLLVYYSRHRPGPQYHVSTAVLLSEIIKLIVAAVMVFREEKWSLSSYRYKLRTEIIEKPRELLRVSVPSLIYAVQNNLNFIGLSSLDSATYQVTSQLKILTTAMFMKLLMRNRFSHRQKFALVFLCLGEMFVHLDSSSDPVSRTSEELGDQDSFKTSRHLFGVLTRNMVESSEYEPAQTAPQFSSFTGIVAVGASCLGSGFAGVYFELVLRNAPPLCTFWLRNLQMYICGVIASAAALLLSQGTSIMNSGFFFGYTPLVILVTVMSASTGLFISVVIHRLSNIWKSFSTALAVVITSVASAALFDKTIDAWFVVGAALVISSPCLYAFG